MDLQAAAAVAPGGATARAASAVPRLESSPELYAPYVTRACMAAYVRRSSLPVCVSLTAPAAPRAGRHSTRAAGIWATHDSTLAGRDDVVQGWQLPQAPDPGKERTLSTKSNERG